MNLLGTCLLRPAQWMCFCVATPSLAFSRRRRGPATIHNLQYILVQTDKTRLTEDQVKVLERFRHPEAFALVEFLGRFPFRDRDVGDGGVSILRISRVVDGLEHAPCSVLQTCIACDPVQDEDRLDGFGPGQL